MRLLLVDDYALIREGLKKILKGEPGIEVVAETGAAGEVIRLVDRHQVDLVVLDISMPGVNGLDVLRDLKKHFPKLLVLMLSMHAEHKYAVRAIKLGAAGYLKKDTALEELVNAIRRLEGGGKYISPALAEHLAEWVAGGEAAGQLHTQLSNREFEVMCKLAAGSNLSQMARLLHISVSTATTYKNRVYAKMGFTTNADLVRYCLSHDLVD
ncbi:MAG: response regulator [Adhaeribacter sp.]